MTGRLTAWLRRAVAAGAAPDRTSAITVERVRAALADRGDGVRGEPDGALTGLWDGYLFRIRLTGSSGGLLSVVGSWGRVVPAALHGPLSQAVNDWNRDRTWPTVFLDGEGGVRTEVVTDFTVGATDAQIADALAVGLTSGVAMLRALSAALPPPAED